MGGGRLKIFKICAKEIKNLSFKTPTFMKDFTTYLSTAPVVALAWFSFTAGFIIEINRFFPDPLVFSF